MKVSELAQAAGVTPETVRYYPRVGLLAPAKDSSNGYRRFDAKRLGCQLDEIAKIFGLADGGRTPCPVVREIVERRIVETRVRLAEMQALQARLENAVALWARMPDGEPDGHAVCALIEATGDRGTDQDG